MKTLKLGAPSLTGRIASKDAEDTFKDSSFPLEVKVTNLVAHALTFPEVSGLHLEACTDTVKRAVVVWIDNFDALQRLVSSIEQIAGLYGHVEMLTIESSDDGEGIGEAEPLIDDTGTELAVIEDSDSSDGDGGDATENAGKKPGRKKKEV